MHRKAFIVISLFWMIVYLIIIKLVLSNEWLPVKISYDTLNVPLVGTSLIIYILLIPLFLMYYFCVYCESASYSILHLIQKYGDLSYEELRAKVPDRSLIITRLDSLVSNEYLEMKDKSYRILPKGIKVVRIMDMYQRLLGWKIGG